MPTAALPVTRRAPDQRQPRPRASSLAGVIVALCALSATACDRSASRVRPDDAPPRTAQPSAAQPSAAQPAGTPSSPGAAEPSAPPAHAPFTDRGVFEDLNEQTEVQCPEWAGSGPYLAVRFEGSAATWQALAGVPVCSLSEKAPPTTASVTLPASALAAGDRDGDGIPDAVDIVRGAKKAAANGAVYKSVYRELPFPGGDVPREEGVCTDVIVRALRNAGFDLQELVAEDIAAHPTRYPIVKDPDPSIDHRRVRTLLPYFLSHFTALSVDPRDTASPYLPGDVVFMDTLGDSAPEHVGVVSDRLGGSGLPLVVNNWNDGWSTKEMDLLGRVPVTHRFRVARPVGGAPVEQAGAAGLLARRSLSVPAEAQQMVLVTTPLWTSSGGTLTRHERTGGQRWRQIGAPLDVRIGSTGLGCGRGLHASAACSGAPPKREGDKRAPAGVFALGTAFGRAAKSPYPPGTWPYRGVTSADRFVDDPHSRHYNTWQVESATSPPRWNSAERLAMYSLGLVVEHNMPDPLPGAGSAIFLHPWKSPAHPTVGCTALDERLLVEVLRWLDPAARPVLVQIAGHTLPGAPADN